MMILSDFKLKLGQNTETVWNFIFMKMRLTLSLAFKTFGCKKWSKVSKATDVTGVINFIEISDF